MTGDTKKSRDRGLVELEDKLRYYMGLAKQGDSTGFAFVRHYALPAIRAYVARKVEHADVDAEEVAELAFDRAEASVSGYSPDRGKVLWWLRGIAWHTIGSYYRVHRPTLPLPADDEGVADSVPGPEELHNEATAEEERRALLRKLDSVLRKIPLRRRQVLIWHHYENRPYSAIAASLGISIEAARQLHYNALEDARKILFEKPPRKKGQTGGQS
jgi:RNA polymerase sigma factor (sigma-70 family)